MMKKINILLLFMLCMIQLQAEIDPIYKECIQRGYTISGEYCVFPDNSKCLIEEFNAGACGEQFMIDDYCIEEGDYVWDTYRCCDGLRAYLPSGMEGQATCQPQAATFWKSLSEDYGLWLLVILLTIIYLVMNSVNKKKRENLKL